MGHPKMILPGPPSGMKSCEEDKPIQTHNGNDEIIIERESVEINDKTLTRNQPLSLVRKSKKNAWSEDEVIKLKQNITQKLPHWPEIEVAKYAEKVILSKERAPLTAGQLHQSKTIEQSNFVRCL